MHSVCSFAVAAALFASMPSDGAPQGGQPATQPPAQTQPQKPAAPPEQKPEQPPKYEETVVVSASKAEEKLVDAPATMSVITSATIETAPTRNFAELLRAVPGVNVTQISARDINITSRNATGTLAT